MTTLTVGFTSTNGIPIGGVIKVKFPKWNPTASTSQLKDYFTGSISCASKTNLNSGLSCAFSGQILTVSNIVTSTAIASNTPVAFTVSGFTNPISTS